MKSLKKKVNSFAYNHIWLRYILDYLFPILATVVSSVVFVFGMVVFLEPALLGGEASDIPAMVSGGSSGAAQVIKLIILVLPKLILKTRELFFLHYILQLTFLYLF